MDFAAVVRRAAPQWSAAGSPPRSSAVVRYSWASVR